MIEVARVERQQTDTQILTGNEAAAEAAKLARVGVVAFFPIGPSDEVCEELVKMIRAGKLDARVLDLPNERSTVNAQIVATQAGVRSIFATNSEGLVFAYQQLFWSAYARVPIVVCVSHRAMEPPTVITPDDHDTIIFRDTGWMQFYCENPQDVLDTLLQAYWVAERQDVLLPAFVTCAGWEVSHGSSPVAVPTQQQVDQFLPRLQLPPGQDFLSPEFDFAQFYSKRPGVTRGFHPAYMELRYKVDRALNDTAKAAIKEAHQEYVRIMGRGYGGVLESYKTDDADVVLVSMGNIAALARNVVDQLRSAGAAVGSVKLRTLRPFPGEELRGLLGKAKVVLVLDRNPVYALTHELRSALYGMNPAPQIAGRVIALGGRDFTSLDLAELCYEAFQIARTGRAEHEVQWRFRVAKG